MTDTFILFSDKKEKVFKKFQNFEKNRNAKSIPKKLPSDNTDKF